MRVQEMNPARLTSLFRKEFEMCNVKEGEGRSTVGDEKIEWGAEDTFTVPHWMWTTHQAASAEADLFIVTDREVHARLDVAREELG
jgi:1-hydroxy-2-naphthoate dioxygenase